MNAMKGASATIDGLVYDFCVLAVEGVLQERRATINPLSSTGQTFADNSDYNRQSLLPWRRDVGRLLVLDLYVFSPKTNRFVLVERWKIKYQKSNDSKDSKPFPVLNRRILTLIRTLVCFIRLLPAFNLLNLSKVKPTMGYQIYEPKTEDSMPPFSNESLKYRFGPVSTSKGAISMGVTYLNPSSIKVSQRLQWLKLALTVHMLFL